MSKKTVNDVILEQLEDLHDKLDEVRTKDLVAIKSDINILKFKTTIWGGLAGLIGGMLTFLMPHRG
jgi:hypothetical protein